jgi:hypothetical protein
MTTGHAILINLYHLNNAPVNVNPPPPNQGGAVDLAGKMVNFDCEYVEYKFVL